MRRLVYLLGTLLVITFVIVQLYGFGWWIPNNPLWEYPVKGIDVSHHQGDINWKAVAADGVRFAYIKATEGSDFQDDHFQQNRDGAIAAGLACGAYHYFTLKTNGKDQAENFALTVKPGMTLPPAIDLETWGNTSERPSVVQFQKELRDFMTVIRKAYGTEPVIYSSSDFIHAYLGDLPINRLWYRAVVTSPHRDGYEQWSFWQFTEKARVKGVPGFVDMDVFRGSVQDLTKLSNERL